MLTELEPLQRLSRDMRKAAETLSDQEARYLVDTYYQLQDQRIRAQGQIRVMATAETPEPHEVLAWVNHQAAGLETSIKGALARYSQASPVGRWAESICGIGPVLSAGLLAHIDMTKAPTVGHIWRFAGLDPTVTWEKKTKRPWNASLKVLCWKIGESFVKVSGNDQDVYGQVYVQRKAREQTKNDAGEFAAQAVVALERKRYDKTTVARTHYTAGRLPPGHIHARAKRYAVKLFLSHWHAVAYTARWGAEPPKPYILTPAGGHVHEIICPNWPF